DGFHKDSIGRIRRDVKEEKHSLSNIETPHVTDDILGIGRKKQEQLSSSMVMVKYKGDDKMVAATKDEKKRGRINFAWGRSKKNTKSSKAPGSGPATNEPPVQHKVPMMPVFGLMLELAVQATKVKEHYELPAVVYRCIEYLDAKKAYTEEGIYRLSGSSVEIEKLKTKFNTRRDYNLLEAGEIYDVHVIAGLLKLYLRELPTSVLTPTLHHDFVRVVDLADRDARVHEMGRLVSDLPLANYTILRSLIAHLIRVVQHEKINKMSQYVIGIVISPSIGIPVGVFNLLMSEFEYIFWVNDEGVPSPRRISGGLVKVKTPGSAHNATPLSVPAPVPQGQPPRQSNEDPTAAKQLSISFKGSAENSLSHANGWDETSEEECVSDSEELARRYEHQKARLTRRIEGMPFNIANGQWPTFDESVDSDFEKFRQRIAKQQVEEFGEEEEGEGEGIDGGG
ncbi:Rho GTPase activating protein, partial [Spiromyces aspiralis]